MSRAAGLPPRARAAVAVTRVVNAASRRVGAGSGTVLGGWAGMAVEPHLLARLAQGRDVALVTGTNGKTTTTRLLVVAAADGGSRPVVSNATGSNMPQGHVAALAAGPAGATAVLEADEGYVPALVDEVRPKVVVLLNLSRDQLDRTNEVRMVAGRWRHALAAAPGTTVVANADDPLVAWGAGSAARVVWVGAGLGWRMDAAGCPACEGRIEFTGDGWACACGFARPALDVWVTHEVADGTGTTAVFADGRRVPVALGIPGRFNEANAVVAAAAAEVLGVPAGRALALMARVDEVAGRFAVRDVRGVPTRLMLAKNPAGWAELLDLVCPGEGPVVVGINARVADGKDPSWLWDVAFERLRGRPVVATGERCRDLAVRLHYGEVAHRTVEDPAAAVQAAAGMAGAVQAAGGMAGAVQAAAGMAGAGRNGPGAPVDFIGNYTAFHDLLARR